MMYFVNKLTDFVYDNVDFIETSLSIILFSLTSVFEHLARPNQWRNLPLQRKPEN
jgi:hypothetical protein